MKQGMARKVSVVLFGCVVLSGCRLTPAVSLQTGLKESPVDITLGRQHEPSPPPPPPIVLFSNPTPTFPAPLAVAPPPADVLVTAPPPNPCPEAGPFAVPAVPAVNTATQRPAEATYPFRFVASLTTNPGASNASTKSGTFLGTKQVSQTTAPDANGVYQFTVTEKFLSFTTDMTFQVYPNGPAGGTVPANSSNPTPGIYLVQMHDLQGNAFQPQPPGVLMMPFPASQATGFQGAGTDPVHSTTMEVDPPQPSPAPPSPPAAPAPAPNPTPSAPPSPPQVTPGSMIKDKARVDACGTVLDSWEVVAVGRIVDAKNGPNSTTNFSLDYEDATQYGGLPIATHLIENFNDPNNNNVPTQYDIQDTINVKPQDPQAH